MHIRESKLRANRESKQNSSKSAPTTALHLVVLVAVDSNAIQHVIKL
jgi:hypothetical protein